MPTTGNPAFIGGDAYQHIMASVGGGVLGGSAHTPSAGFFGGGEDEDPSKDLRSYRDSLAAATKERIFRGLARALKGIGMNGIDPETSKPGEILAAIADQIPSPSKNGKTFKKEAEEAFKVCTSVANALNNEFTPGAMKLDRLIDTSLGPASVCRQVAELVASMASGLNTEFLEVHASLTRIVRNLTMLDEVLEELHGKVMTIADRGSLRTGDDKTLASVDSVYRRSQKIREEQLLMLKNYLSVTLGPAKEELAIAMRDVDDKNSVVARLQLKPGSSEFADNLAEVVSGLGTVAAMSTRVDSALKTVGLGIQKYLDAGDIGQLTRELDDMMMSGDGGKKDLAAFLAAAGTLKQNFYRRSDLELGEHVGVAGGAAGDDDEKMSKLDKRVRKRKTERKLLVQEFINKSTRHYDALLKSIQEVGPKLGKEIPIGDKMRKLRDAFVRMGNSPVAAEMMALQLIGFVNQASDRQRKEQFLSGLRDVNAALDDVMSASAYQATSHYFAPMREAISGLVRTIDFFSDTFTKKYGAGEAAGDAGDAEETATGGADGDDFNDMPRVARSGYDLNRSVVNFRYFFYVSQIRANLKGTEKELEHFGEKYSNVLGDAVAGRLKTLDDLEKEKMTALTALKNAQVANDANVKTVEAAIKLIKNQYKCKRGFYKSLQALDLYLKAFTDGISSHPDDAVNVKGMLDGTEVIARWFTENTGNDLAKAFDCMKTADGNDTSEDFRKWTPAGGARGAGADPKDHYYDNLVVNAGLTGTQYNVGEPLQGQPAGSALAKAAANHVSDVYDNFQALKNIVTTFSRVGSKFGGADINQKIFRSPTQIFRDLMEYLKCSSMVVGVKGAPPTNMNTTSVLFDDITRATTDVDFATENMYFTFVVKAMAAKILTVLGVSDMFERPSPVYDLTPTRIIIGGAEYEEIPISNHQASELYFRLPRLAEFYRAILGFKGAGDEPVQIALLPEVEGVFSGLVKLVFLRVSDAYVSGSYSDFEMRTMVREINSIYDHFKAEEDPCSKALSAFVMEINRRYGVVKRSEWESLNKLLRDVRDQAGARSDANTTDYSILPGEGEYQVERRAPSDRFLSGSSADEKKRKNEFEVDTINKRDQWKLLKDFRERIDNEFAKVKVDQFDTLSYSALINQAAKNMDKSESVDDKFRIATMLIQGSNDLADSDVSKSMMFHETVVVGINTLNALQQTLGGYRDLLQNLDIAKAQKEIGDMFDAACNAPPAGGVINYALIAQTVSNDGTRRYIHADGDRIGRRNGNPVAGTSYIIGVYNVATSFATMFRGLGPAGRDNARSQTIKNQVKEYLITNCIKAQDVVRDILQTAMSLSEMKGMVDVRFPNTQTSKLAIDFSGVAGVAQTLMADVRFYLDKFRSSIDKDTYDRYDGGSKSGGADGSYFWLEENLMDGLIAGQARFRLDGDGVNTLDRVASAANTAFTNLVSMKVPSLAALTAVAMGGGYDMDDIIGIVDSVANPKVFEQYGELLSALIFYDATQVNSGVAGVNVRNLGGAPPSPLESYISTSRPRVNVNTGQITRGYLSSAPAGIAPQGVAPTTVMVPGAGAAFRLSTLWTVGGGFTGARSLMFSLNQVLALYLQLFVDNTGKIYRGLIEGFAAGSLSQQVMSLGVAIPDLVSAAGGFGQRGEPKTGVVLLQSIALILQRLMVDTNPTTQISDHLQSTLSEVPQFMLESYRANLPQFVKLLKNIQSQCEFLKNVLSRTGIEVTRPNQSDVANDAVVVLPNITAVAPGAYPQGVFENSMHGVNHNLRSSSREISLSLQGHLDAIASAAYSVANSALGVHRELADDALYLQTQTNSIQDYKARYNKMPLMPLSLLTTYFRGDPAPWERRLPTSAVGSTNFKFMYGSRKLLGLAKTFSADDAPGLRAIVDAYNSSASERAKVDSNHYFGFAEKTLAGMRFLELIKYVDGMLAPVVPGVAGSPVGDAIRSLIVMPPNVRSFSVIETPEVSISVVEASDQAATIGNITKSIGATAGVRGVNNREVERMASIIDTNTMPINVHALMRTMPLVPTFNYAYSFEQEAALMYGETRETIDKVRLDTPDDVNTRRAFLKMVCEPYCVVSPDKYGLGASANAGPIARIFRGDDSLLMGRPKFVSDQLFNKALFGSLMPSADFNESGPPGMSRAAVAGDTLTYLGKQTGVRGDPTNQGSVLKEADLGADGAAKVTALAAAGKRRFDTTLVRNLFFISNIQRLLRLKMQQELTMYRNVLVSSHQIVNPGVTEYGSLPAASFSGSRRERSIYAANEVSGSRSYGDENPTGN